MEAVELAAIGVALESFFAGGLNAVLQAFVRDNSSRHEPAVSAGAEHSHCKLAHLACPRVATSSPFLDTDTRVLMTASFSLFQEFQQLVERELARFLESRELSMERLVVAVQELHDAGESDLSPHLAFLYDTDCALETPLVFCPSYPIDGAGVQCAHPWIAGSQRPNTSNLCGSSRNIRPVGLEVGWTAVMLSSAMMHSSAMTQLLQSGLDW